MDDEMITKPPKALAGIITETKRLDFDMASDPKTGALLRTLAASKACGQLLEIGTGTGLSTAWLLDGMSADARLITIDVDMSVSAVARRFLGEDPRLTIIVDDALEWLQDKAEGPFDLIFADAVPGKYEGFDAAWALLTNGGFYIIDDMLPQPSWPEGHAPKVKSLLAKLDARPDCRLVRMSWSTGLVVVVKIP